MRLLVVGASVLAMSAVSAQPPTRDRLYRSGLGTATIAGRVIDAVTGEPLRNVQVRVVGRSLLGDHRVATTDVEGRYIMRNLPAGEYTVSASKPRYITAGAERNQSFEVANGGTLDNVDVRLTLGGVVAGRITDEFGEPSGSVEVCMARVQSINRSRRLCEVGKRMTNDLGEFRLFGISPGDYYLAAVFPQSRLTQPASDDANAPMFYPGSGGLNGAQALRIGPGQTVSGLSMILLPVHGVHLGGTVTDSNGRMVVNGTVTLNEAPHNGGASTTSSIRPDGTFSFSNVTPGEVLIVSNRGNSANGERALMRLTVANSDLTDITLMMLKASTVSGRVVLDRAARGTIKSSDVLLNADAAYANDALITSGNVPATVNQDFSFTLKAWAGRLRIGSGGTAHGWTIKAVRLNGADVTDAGFELGSATLGDVEVELTNIVSEISGTVVGPDGAPTHNACVVVFTQDRDKWPIITRGAFATRPGRDGRYRVRPLAPGAYYVISASLSTLETGEWRDTDFLDRASEHAVPLLIATGEQKTRDLVLATVDR